MQEKRLTKSQKQLFKSWEAEYRNQLASFSAALSENLNLKLERIASELGIDVDETGWSFDAQSLSFKKMDEPKPEIPGRKAGKAKTENKPTEEEVKK